MRISRVVFIILVLLTLFTTAASFSMPFQLSPLESYPASATTFGPVGTYSTGPINGNPMAVNAPVSNTPSAGNSNLVFIPMPLGSAPPIPLSELDQNFQLPGPGYNKWIDHYTGPMISGMPYDLSFKPMSVTQAIATCPYMQKHYTSLVDSSLKLLNSTQHTDENNITSTESTYQFMTTDGKTHICHVGQIVYPPGNPVVQDIDGESYVW